MKRTYLLIMIILMIGSVFGTLAYYTLVIPNCPLPSGGMPAILGSGVTNINGVDYTEINVTFTAKAQQVASSGITFRTTSFLDPTVPHLSNGSCITEPEAPFQLTLQATFGDGVSMRFPTITYGGNPPAQSFNPYFIQHGTFRAGVETFQGQDFLHLLFDANTI
jgi:hypothetical protein